MIFQDIGPGAPRSYLPGRVPLPHHKFRQPGGAAAVHGAARLAPYLRRHGDDPLPGVLPQPVGPYASATLKITILMPRHTRVHIFSRQNWLLTGPLGLACLTTLAVIIRKTVLISLNKSVASFAAGGREILVMFALGAVGKHANALTCAYVVEPQTVDLIMAMLQVYYLSQGRTGIGKYVILGGMIGIPIRY